MKHAPRRFLTALTITFLASGCSTASDTSAAGGPELVGSTSQALNTPLHDSSGYSFASPDDDTWIGINYFSGWHTVDANGNALNSWALGNKFMRPWTSDWWIDERPDRDPLLGREDIQSVMDQEIMVAASHGVNFFDFLVFGSDTTSTGDYTDLHLNDGVEHFLSSPQNYRMQFAVRWENTPTFPGGSGNYWPWIAQLTTWICNPHYVQFNGHRMFSIDTWESLATELSTIGKTPANFIADLTNAVSTSGCGGLYVGVNVGYNEDIPLNSSQTTQGVAFSSSYGSFPGPSDGYCNRCWYPYTDEITFQWNKATAHLNQGAPHIPVADIGWDPAPWSDDPSGEQNPWFGDPNYSYTEWTLANMNNFVNDFPASRLGGKKIIQIYAWNEYGEGGSWPRRPALVTRGFRHCTTS
jgi:hypothetical protein